MSSIAIIVAIFSLFLRGGEEKKTDDQGVQPVVVARGEVSTATEIAKKPEATPPTSPKITFGDLIQKYDKEMIEYEKKLAKYEVERKYVKAPSKAKERECRGRFESENKPKPIEKVVSIDFNNPDHIQRSEQVVAEVEVKGKNIGVQSLTRYFTQTDIIEIPAGYDYEIYENDENGKPMKNRGNVCGGINLISLEEIPVDSVTTSVATDQVISFASSRMLVRICGVAIKTNNCNAMKARQSYTIVIKRNKDKVKTQVTNNTPFTDPTAKKE